MLTKFVVFDFATRYKETAKEIVEWLVQDKLNQNEHIMEGIESFPEIYLMPFSSENLAS